MAAEKIILVLIAQEALTFSIPARHMMQPLQRHPTDLVNLGIRYELVPSTLCTNVPFSFDDDAVAVPSYVEVCESAQKLKRFLILLMEFVLGARRIRANAVNDVPADDDQVGGSHRWRFFRRVVSSIVFKGIQKDVITDRIVRITMQIGYVQYAEVHWKLRTS